MAAMAAMTVSLDFALTDQYTGQRQILAPSAVSWLKL
jgi:hypothetical protein